MLQIEEAHVKPKRNGLTSLFDSMYIAVIVNTPGEEQRCQVFLRKIIVEHIVQGTEDVS